MDQNIIDWTWLNEVFSILFEVLILFGFTFAGSLVYDIWCYKRHQEPISLPQDGIVGLIFAAIISMLIAYVNIPTRVMLGIAFFCGVIGVDVLGIIIRPSFIPLFFKNLMRKIKDNPLTEAIADTVDEMKKDEKDAKEEKDRAEIREELKRNTEQLKELRERKKNQ